MTLVTTCGLTSPIIVVFKLCPYVRWPLISQKNKYVPSCNMYQLLNTNKEESLYYDSLERLDLIEMKLVHVVEQDEMKQRET